ncbi:hypothetical protein BpHYR1_054277 [Brachionus plicatilis]|uniref:G-protein coupled receptors family 2 profile 2 domain-containing protein n=1 Tax=Brachionus plicatilis TaxID=10195 RepID=A0A3M7P389_BRAPC|nr:hypothetical protein BpHYR1_054277 [Brachionus plicatilis]
MFLYLYDFHTTPSINSSKSWQPFDMTLYEIETWLTIGLSSLSFISILIVTITYIIAHFKARDHAKETKMSVIRKLVKNEYLVLSYCSSLFISHLITPLHKLASKYFLSGFVRTDLMCLVVGILKHFLWLSCLFHSNAISFKIYLKLSKTMNANLMRKDNWLKSASKIFFYIYGATFVISACSIAIHFAVKQSNVYELGRKDRINSCFLSQPLYLIVFFAFPVLIILSMNSTLFVIVYLKTRSTLDSSECTEGNNLFLKLAIIMGLSWFVYVVGVVVTEIVPNHLLAQIIVLITSCQVNLQGFIIVLGLFWGACCEFLFNKKHRVNKDNQGNKKKENKVRNLTVL